MYVVCKMVSKGESEFLWKFQLNRTKLKSIYFSTESIHSFKHEMRRLPMFLAKRFFGQNCWKNSKAISSFKIMQFQVSKIEKLCHFPEIRFVSFWTEIFTWLFTRRVNSSGPRSHCRHRRNLKMFKMTTTSTYLVIGYPIPTRIRIFIAVFIS